MENFNIVKGRRLRILKLLGADWKGGVAVVNTRQRMNVTSIIIKMRDASQSLVSQNLKELRDAGLVSTERSGKEIFYQLAEDFGELVKNLGNPDVDRKKHRALKTGKNRQEVIKFLKEKPGAQVKDICPELGRDTVSQELTILRTAGVATFREEGKKRFYTLIGL
jgi:DNA-binding transcriptional ArsR family regulator